MVILGSMPLSMGVIYRSTLLVGSVRTHLKCLHWAGKALESMCSKRVLISFWLDAHQICFLAEFQSWCVKNAVTLDAVLLQLGLNVAGRS